MADAPFSSHFLGQYEMIRLLGRGGMGAVYLMRQRSLNRLVAVKVVRPGELTADRAHRLLKEAQILASCAHPAILAIHDVGFDEDVPYLVSEYVEGESLAERIVRVPPLSLTTRLRIAIQILDGLKEAHRRNVIHRDLKPANIFLGLDGKPKIGDFGLAKVLVLPSATAAGKVVGTPAYMSPEQCHGRPATPASDIYAMGVMLFQLVTGQRPFRGPSTQDYVTQQVNDAPPPIRSLVADLPLALEAVVDRALAKDPAERFRSPQEMRKALQEVQRSLQSMRDAKRPEIAEGEKLGSRYELVRILGQGGMGQVWLAHDCARQDAEVAVKLLPPELWRDATSRASLVQEATLSLRLSHPNIVRMINLETGDSPFLVLEYVRGPTLAEELAGRQLEGKGPLSAQEALPIIEELALALDHAHGKSVIHRDLKPSNVILEIGADGGRTAKLADFGIAAEAASFRTRQTGMVPMGTLRYMSPEQIRCEKLDGRSDIYALGATLFELLTLAPPHAGDGDLAWAIQHALVPAPAGVPGPVSEVLSWALSKDRDARPATASALALAYRKAVGGVGPSSAPTDSRAPSRASATGARWLTLISIVGLAALILTMSKWAVVVLDPVAATRLVNVSGRGPLGTAVRLVINGAEPSLETTVREDGSFERREIRLQHGRNVLKVRAHWGNRLVAESEEVSVVVTPTPPEQVKLVRSADQSVTLVGLLEVGCQPVVILPGGSRMAIPIGAGQAEAGKIAFRARLPLAGGKNVIEVLSVAGNFQSMSVRQEVVVAPELPQITGRVASGDGTAVKVQGIEPTRGALVMFEGAKDRKHGRQVTPSNDQAFEVELSKLSPGNNEFRYWAYLSGEPGESPIRSRVASLVIPGPPQPPRIVMSQVGEAEVSITGDVPEGGSLIVRAGEAEQEHPVVGTRFSVKVPLGVAGVAVALFSRVGGVRSSAHDLGLMRPLHATMPVPVLIDVPAVVSTRSITIRGQSIAGAGIRVRLPGVELSQVADDAGRFSVPIRLQEGANEVRVMALSPIAQRASLPAEVRVTFRPTAGPDRKERPAPQSAGGATASPGRPSPVPLSPEVRQSPARAAPRPLPRPAGAVIGSPPGDDDDDAPVHVGVTKGGTRLEKKR